MLKAQLPEHRGRATLVLDLDHTLVDGNVKRPGLDEFLDRMAALYEVVIFTARPKELAEDTVEQINKGRIASSLYGECCDMPAPGIKYKLLKKLGRDLKRVVVIDDTPGTYKFNEANALPITGFYAGAEDTDSELIDLIPFLSSISEKEDVRSALCQRKGYTNAKGGNQAKAKAVSR